MRRKSTLLWPNLGFVYLGGLDYAVTQYDREGLQRLAKTLAADKARLTPASRAAADCLRHLAKTPAAIKALNHHRPSVPGEIVETQRALHYLVRSRLLGNGGSEEAFRQIAQVWRKGVLTIRENLTARKAAARDRLESIIRDKPEWTERKILKALDADLTARAAQEKFTKKIPV